VERNRKLWWLASLLPVVVGCGWALEWLGKVVGIVAPWWAWSIIIGGIWQASHVAGVAAAGALAAESRLEALDKEMSTAIQILHEIWHRQDRLAEPKAGERDQIGSDPEAIRAKVESIVARVNANAEKPHPTNTAPPVDEIPGDKGTIKESVNEWSDLVEDASHDSPRATSTLELYEPTRPKGKG
jgi:hypothetical protein